MICIVRRVDQPHTHRCRGLLQATVDFNPSSASDPYNVGERASTPSKTTHDMSSHLSVQTGLSFFVKLSNMSLRLVSAILSPASLPFSGPQKQSECCHKRRANTCPDSGLVRRRGMPRILPMLAKMVSAVHLLVPISSP